MIGHQIEIRRASERFATRMGWLDSRHCFSFGHHYDPENTHFGLLVVSNDDVVKPGTGFSTHPHRDMEIVTWVLEGELEHKDSTGNTGIIVPGDAQRMTAGRGILHSEMNPGVKPVHFLQMWVLPDTERLDPGYQSVHIGDIVQRGGLFPIASGRGRDAAIRIHQKDAELWGATLRAGQSIQLPQASTAHLYVARGSVDLEGAGPLQTGDAVRIVDTQAARATASTDSDVLIWAFQNAA